MELEKKNPASQWSFPFVLAVFGVLLGVHSLLRLVFFIGNSGQAGEPGFTDLMIAFLTGLRFDIATIFIFNGWIFLFMILPLPFFRSRLAFRIANILLIFVNLPLIAVNTVDVAYYSMSEKRLTHEFFSTTTPEIFNIPAGDTIATYGGLLLIFLLLSFAFIWLLRKFTKKTMGSSPNARRVGGWKSWSPPILALALMITGIRGGWQTMPLRPSHAFVSGNRFAGILGLNSAYTILSSMVLNTSQITHMIPEEEARSRLAELIKNDFDQDFPDKNYPFLRRADFPGPENKTNVVLIIMESLNASYCGVIGNSDENITPGFDKLSKRGILFTHFHANATRSVEALPAILNSIPDIFNRPIIGSDRETINHQGLGNILAAKNYATSFYHGGRNGTMGFDNYSRISGFAKYYGMDEYPDTESDFDGMWGIFDFPFFEWWASELSNHSQPFFSVLFTVSNHHPFRIPDEGFSDIVNSNLSDLKKTTKYSDRALVNFFDLAEKTTWFENTIFIITADHTFHESDGNNRDILDLSHIPLLIIAPGLEPKVDDRTADQLDILPTIIELLRLDIWHASAGRSLLTADQQNFAVTNHSGIYTLTGPQYAWSTDFEKNMPCLHRDASGGWKHIDASDIPIIVARQMDYDLRCFYQETVNCRLENRIIAGKWMK